MVENFVGTLGKYYKRDEFTGNTIFGIETDEIDVKRNKDGLIKSEGIIPRWPIDTNIIVSGTWEEETFNIHTIKPYTETIEMSKKLLRQVVKELKEEDETFKISASGIKKILGITGEDLLSFLKEKNALETLIINAPKIKKESLELIYNRLMVINHSYSILEYISKFGGTPESGEKLIKLYGKQALRIFKLNPYKTGFLVGMDFFTCDRAAKELKFDALDEKRINSLIYTSLDNLLNQYGSTYITNSMLKINIDKILRKSSYPNEKIPAAVIAERIQNLSGILIEKMNNGIRIYKKKLWNDEMIIVKHLKRLNQKKEYKNYNIDDIYEAEKYLKIKYSEKQKEAFSILKSNGVKIITGGPGTGKTTVINGIIHMYEIMHPTNKIILCAPTGRAAQRMSEVTNMEAETIHRTLEFRPYSDGKMHHKDADSPLDGDLIILDEMSMVDTEIFALFLPAIKTGSTVILIGDENQLQSVSSGNILHDLIESHCFETYRLKEVFRQKGKNTIIDNAYKVLDGKLDFIKDETFEIKQCENIKEALTELESIFDIDNKDNIQILSPVKIGDGGTKAINHLISKKINNEDDEIFRYFQTTYHINDKVIFLKNNYEKEYYNGDIGYISEILKTGFLVKLGTEEIRITGECLKEVSLAYAITIHKAQGSEADEVIIILPDTYSNMLNRNMLFTGITRAKKKVKIIYINSALYDSVHTITVDKRFTGLVDKLLGKKREVVMCR